MDTNLRTLAQWASMAEVQAHLGLRSRQAVYDLIKLGLPVHQASEGGRLWFDLVEVDEFIRSRCFAQSEPAA